LKGPQQGQCTFTRPRSAHPTSGSTLRASLSASLLAMSALAGDTARMRAVGLDTYSRHSFRICRSMSVGWSPTGTCVQHKNKRARGNALPHCMRWKRNYS
jgi:hypothetical protein